MIALNELLENLDSFKATYNKLSVKVNLYKIKKLEDKRKVVQLESEGLRAECNKLCSSVAELKNKNLDTTKTMSSILKLDRKINKLSKKLDRFGKKINYRLKKLRNLPVDFVAENEEFVADSVASFGIFADFLKEKCEGNVFTSNLTPINQLKSFQNWQFKEPELPAIYFCKNGVLYIDTDFNIIENFEAVTEFLKQNSSKLIRICSAKTDFSSADEYDISFIDGNFKLLIQKEFISREYNIKYKNSKIDMTKFVNSFIIELKKR